MKSTTLVQVIAMFTTTTLALHAAETKQLPVAESYPVVKELPDPFRKADGSRAQTPAEWPAQREYLKRLVLETKYGLLPAAAEFEVSGREAPVVASDGADIVRKSVTLRIARRNANPPAAIEVPVMLYLPSKEARRWPVIVTNERHVRLDPLDNKRPLPTEWLRQGCAVAVLMLSQIADDRPQKNNGLYVLYPGLDCGVLAAWAWGYHRTIDYLLSRDDMDPKRIAVQGFSRYGMASLVAGMLDERIALTITGGSNVGGVQPVRQHAQTGPRQTPPRPTEGNPPVFRPYDVLIRVPERWPYWYWFTPRYQEFYGKEQHLPMDSHTAMLLCAPRGLLLSEGMGDQFGYCAAVEQTVLAAREVYGFLGAADKLAVVTHGGGHGMDWAAIGAGAAWMLGVGEKKTDYQALKWPGMDRLFSWSAPQTGGQQSNEGKQP